MKQFALALAFVLWPSPAVVAAAEREPPMKKLVLALVLAFAVAGSTVAISSIINAPVAACPTDSSGC